MNIQSVFQSFNDHARVWFYFFNRPLNRQELQDLKKNLDAFMMDWNSHKENVRGDYVVFENQLAVLCTEHEGISGCSIDSSVRIFKDFRSQKGADALDRNNIFYRNKAGKIESVKRRDFFGLQETKKIDEKTPVFDLTAQTLGELRTKGIEKKLGESWHAQLISQETM